MGGARQHAVFGSHPALALATQKTRYTIFHAGGAQHAGVAKTDQHRAFGMAGETAFDLHRAQRIAGTSAWAGRVVIRHFLSGNTTVYHYPSTKPGNNMISSMTAYAPVDTGTT